MAEHEADPDRRRTLDVVRSRLADRDRGAKVAEAAELLGITPPTVRAWITSGVLVAVPEARPIRVDTLCLADVKRALDLIREHSDDRHLLAEVYRVLRDRAALEGAEGLCRPARRSPRSAGGRSSGRDGRAARRGEAAIEVRLTSVADRQIRAPRGRRKAALRTIDEQGERACAAEIADAERHDRVHRRRR